MKPTNLMAALVLVGSLMPVAAWADCELGCSAECKQEAVICVGAANLEGRVGRQQCESEAADALVVCDSDALDARTDCVGLCGPDLKGCSNAAKAALKACKDDAKIALAGCLNEVATQLDADRTACSDDNADCSSSCVD